MRTGRWRRWVSWCAALAVLTACGPKGEGNLSSASGLVAMLREAGATVKEISVAAPPAFEAPAAYVLQVNGGLVYVYEYGSTADVDAVAALIGPEGMSMPGEGLPWEGRVSAWPAGKLLVVYPGTDGGLLLLLNGLLGDPLTASPEGPEEPYPPAVAAAIATWAGAQSVDPASVQVVNYLAATWMNGCLGLPVPGESCAPGEVGGWIVDLKAGDLTGSAHTDDLGLHVRLAPSPGN